MSSSTKSVCVIGAGAAGLCAGLHCLRAGHKVVLFEQESEAGGTWVFREQTGTHSSMYANLRTNLPKELMAFPSFPFPFEAPSFPSHRDVLRYLQMYGAPVHPYIRFGTKVRHVERVGERWQVEVENADGHSEKFTFDVVFVCNGHFCEPREPFFAAKLGVPWLHSHDYRRPQPFAGRRMAVVGAGNSGVDVALELAEVCAEVWLSHKCHGSSNLELPSNVHLVPEVVDASGSTLMLNDNGGAIEPEGVVFATGYRYTFPFLAHNILHTVADESFVGGLFVHTVHRKFPDSLFFLGLNQHVVPFILFEQQMLLALPLMQGQVHLRPEQMDSWESDRLKSLEARGLPPKRFHVLHDEQWAVYEQLAHLRDGECTVPPVMKKLYDFVGHTRRTQICTYRSYNYTITDPNTFEFQIEQDNGDSIMLPQTTE